MNRHLGESFVDYLKRVTLYLEEDKIGYKEWGDLILGVDNNYTSDNLRKAFYVINKLLPKLDGAANITEEDILKNIQEQKDELYKEKCRLQDARREYNKNLRLEARYENLLDVVRDCIGELEEIQLHHHELSVDTGVEAALLLSDIHYGATVDNVFNYYDTDVCKERLNVLLDKTIYYCTLHKVNTLYINLGGDLVSGIIHCNSRCEAEEDIISQTMQVSELICQFIGKISKYVPNIKVACVQGNHSRVTPNLKESVNEENFERIIFSYIKIRFPDLTIIQNGKEDWCCYQIKDRTVMLEHGDKTKLSNVKEKAVNMLGYAPDDIFLGHWHHMQVIEDNGTEIVVNGSVMGTDSFSMKCRLNSRPHQVLRIYDKDVLTYKITLDNQ